MSTTLELGDRLTLAQLRVLMPLVRDAMRDKSYRLLPLGGHCAAYLRAKRKRLTDASYREYEGVLDKLARYFVDIEMEDLEPPIGTMRVEEFLEAQWGRSNPNTYNKNLSILRDFFKFQVVRGPLHGDPTLAIERARKRQVYRTTFTPDHRRALLASATELRDRIALRLLLDYGIRKGSLQAIQFKHFDHSRRRLTIFAKGAKVRELPIPQPDVWTDLERHILDSAAKPDHYLMGRQSGSARTRIVIDPTKPMGVHGLHMWWYRRLAAAGVVEPGTTSGERMHKARHTAGQRVLDATGNLKAVQKLLGHASIQTTGDIYADWDIDQLARTLESVLAEEG